MRGRYWQGSYYVNSRGTAELCERESREIEKKLNWSSWYEQGCVWEGRVWRKSITWLGREVWSTEWSGKFSQNPRVRNRAISRECEKEVIWHEVRRSRNPDTERWELFQTGLVGEMRMLKECRESLVCMKCTWSMEWLFDYYFYFFHPCRLPCCSSGLNSPFPYPAISTIAHGALCWREVWEMIHV